MILKEEAEDLIRNLQEMLSLLLKCELTVTNFRLDYTFVSSFSSVVSTNLSKPSSPLFNVVISVPVSGGVGNVLSKPVGVWMAEENKMVWKLGNLQPTEPPGRGHVLL